MASAPDAQPAKCGRFAGTAPPLMAPSIRDSGSDRMAIKAGVPGAPRNLQEDLLGRGFVGPKEREAIASR